MEVALRLRVTGLPRHVQGDAEPVGVSVAWLGAFRRLAQAANWYDFAAFALGDALWAARAKASKGTTSPVCESRWGHHEPTKVALHSTPGPGARTCGSDKDFGGLDRYSRRTIEQATSLEVAAGQ